MNELPFGAHYKFDFRIILLSPPPFLKHSLFNIARTFPPQFLQNKTFKFSCLKNPLDSTLSIFYTRSLAQILILDNLSGQEQLHLTLVFKEGRKQWSYSFTDGALINILLDSAV